MSVAPPRSSDLPKPHLGAHEALGEYPGINHDEHFHYTRNPACYAFSPRPNQDSHDISTFCIILPFPEPDITGIVQYEVFGLRSHNNTHLRFSFLQVFSWLEGSFLYSARYYSTV